MKISPFEVREPNAPELPVLVSIPHTGTYVPEAISADFASEFIHTLPMTDWHLHNLYDFLPAMGVTTLFATYSRFVADLNRPPDDQPLYPGRFETGIVARETFWGDPIYRTPPSPEEIARRRELVHAPYHARLHQLLMEKIGRFGHAILIDAHSVASRANRVHGELKHDVFLGDRDGRSNDGRLTELFEAAFREAGLKVVRNNPYKGGYITENYGRMEHVQALQIEMRWGLYLDERHPEQAPSYPGFSTFKEDLRGIFGSVCRRLADDAKAAK